MATGDSVDDPLVGKLLRGRFLPRAVVHRTADVVVYEGVDEKTQRSVRIQRPVAHKLAPAQMERVKACGPDLARLTAVPGVLPVLEGGIESGIPFLVFPALPGGTVADRLRHGRPAAQGPAAVRALRSWLDAVAATLDAVHALGVTHGRLAPDAIVVGADGTAIIDGLPVSHMLRIIGLRPRAPAAGDPLAAYRAPELANSPQATPPADQYALAAIVAEALGRRLKAVDKALSPQPERRFPSCAAFAAAVRAELESAPAAAASVSPSDAPLELENPDAAEGVAPNGGRPAAAVQGFELELEEIESEDQLRQTRRHAAAVEEEDIADITFTKPGQSLLTPQTGYDKATNLAGARASWRRMLTDFKGLSTRKQWITRLVVGACALLLALWILRAGWRAAEFLVRSGHAVATDAIQKLQPNVGKLRESSQQFAEQMRKLWDEHVPADEEVEAGALITPKAAPQPVQDAGPIGGDAWPGRAQDRLVAEQIKEPNELIDDLVRHKGAFTPDGIGVFHVDDPRSPDRHSWIGSFGLLRKPGISSRPLLHGTLVHHADDDAVFVARYARGKIRDFWCVEGPAKKSFIAYASMMTKNEEPAPDGAAFVLDHNYAACLALVYQDGALVGGQWCKKASDEKQEYVFEPPRTIVSIDKLEAEDERFAEYKARLDEAIADMPAVQEQALTELRKFVRIKKLR